MKRGKCEGIRRELATCGIDVDHLSDDELEERAARIARAMSQAGVSMRDATAALARSFSTLGSAFGKSAAVREP